MSQAVKLSARKVQELLACKITAEQLFSDQQHRQRIDDGVSHRDPCSDADDDLLEIRFGPPGPGDKEIHGIEVRWSVDVSSGIKAERDAGRRSREEERVKLVL
jgi:hypothetical protein